MKSQTIFLRIKWEGSLVVLLVQLFYNALATLSLFNWIVFFYERKKNKHIQDNQVNFRMPMLFIDIYVFTLLLAETFVFLFGERSLLMILLGIYGLIDILCTTLRDVILSPSIHKDEDGSYIEIRHSERWIYMAMINVFQVILCFAMIIYFFGEVYPDGTCNFNIEIDSKLTAIYYSFVSFTTVGFGEIHPVVDIGKVIISLELVYFILLVLIKFPIAINLFRIKIVK